MSAWGARAASASATAAAQVVLTTPPLPAKRRRRTPGGAMRSSHAASAAGLIRRGASPPHGDARPVERADPVLGLLERQRLGQEHPDKRAAVRVAQLRPQ